MSEVIKPKSGFVTRLDEMKLRNMRQVYGHMEFHEVVELAEQADSFLEHMNIFDPAWKKFTHERRVWWEYAWLINCENGGGFSPSDSHVRFHNFLVAFPWKQPALDSCDFVDWLRERKEDVCEEWGHWLPVYLRPDEINAYAVKIYHHHKGLVGNGWLRDLEIVELAQEDDSCVRQTKAAL